MLVILHRSVKMPDPDRWRHDRAGLLHTRYLSTYERWMGYGRRYNPEEDRRQQHVQGAHEVARAVKGEEAAKIDGTKVDGTSLAN